MFKDVLRKNVWLNEHLLRKDNLKKLCHVKAPVFIGDI